MSLAQVLSGSMPLSRTRNPKPENLSLRSALPAEQLVTIDRSGLRQEAEHQHGTLEHKEPETAMARHLKALIRVRIAVPSCRKTHA